MNKFEENVKKFITEDYEQDRRCLFSKLQDCIQEIEHVKEKSLFTQVGVRPILPIGAIEGDGSDWSAVFLDISRTVARAEIEFLIKQLTEKIMHQKIKFEEIRTETIGTVDSVVMISDNLIFKLLNQGIINYVNGEGFMLEGIPVIEFSHKIINNLIVLINKKALKIKYKTRNGERLWVDIGTSNKINKVIQSDILARSIMDINIIDPNKIKVLEIE